ncbi:MAG: hypothetical protein ACRD0H_22655, partial [Actinomycetes bacterium]
MSRGLELVELAIGYRPSRGRRPPRVVAKAICATAAPGELTTLLGPNGTGKSTLVWLLDAHSALCTGPPEHLVADGHINAAFDSENLTFDQETVGFPLRATPIGTARLTASSVAGARVLARLGWEVATTGPTDIEVRATGTDFDVHGGSRTRRVDGLAGWARTVRPGQLRRADPAQVTAALVALARFGPFFAVHLDQPDNTALPMAERISSAAGRLGTQDRR